ENGLRPDRGVDIGIEGGRYPAPIERLRHLLREGDVATEGGVQLRPTVAMAANAAWTDQIGGERARAYKHTFLRSMGCKPRVVAQAVLEAEQVRFGSDCSGDARQSAVGLERLGEDHDQ